MTTDTLKDVFERAQSWPVEDQDELAEYAREIQARRTGMYLMTPDEHAAVLKGLAEAERGAFATDEEVAQADRRHQR